MDGAQAYATLARSRFGEFIGMKIKTAIVVVFVTLCSQIPLTGVLAQEALSLGVVGEATAISGVVEGGAAIERVLTGYNGLDDPIGLAQLVRA